MSSPAIQLPQDLRCFAQPVQTDVANHAGFRQIHAMSDKQLALDSIERLPEDASLEQIAERVEFLAAIRKGADQLERGDTISHDEVKRQLASWLSR